MLYCKNQKVIKMNDELNKFEFTEEQLHILNNIDNIDDLLKIFRRLIYISGCSYVHLSWDMKSKFEKMLTDILNS